MDDENTYEDADNQFVASTCSSVGGRRKHRKFHKENSINGKQLFDAIEHVEASKRKNVQYFTLNEDWPAVAGIYFNSPRVRSKEKIKTLYRYYNRYKSQREHIDEEAEPHIYPSFPDPSPLNNNDNTFTSSERRKLSVVGEVVKSAAAGIVQSAMAQATALMLNMKTPNQQYPPLA